MKKLLIADDEKSICSSLSFALEDYYQIYTSSDESSTLDIINSNDISIVLLDLRLGKDDGIDVLKKIKKINPEIPVIIMSAYGTIESTFKAVHNGAFYFISKPINMEELLLLINKSEEYINLNNTIKNLKQEINKTSNTYNMIGDSKKIKDIFHLIDKVKDIDSNILITGESGTGKELVAKALHYKGSRKEKPFNAINCSAIPNHLLEGELFGFKKGSFTGAIDDKKGIIELSKGGTLFLDEIGDMDINLQTKLLRVLQDKEIRPLGYEKGTIIDVRFVCATNKDLKKELKENKFRKDLYYRLNVINIHLPPLRERKEDIPKLVESFIKKFNISFDKEIKSISPIALKRLEDYDFEGNIRELENIIERAIALSSKNLIEEEDLPEEIYKSKNIIETTDDVLIIPIGENLKSIEKKVIKSTLEKFELSRKKTSEILGISERSLRYKIKEYNLK